MRKFISRKKIEHGARRHDVPQPGEEGFRVRLPRDNEIFGHVTALNGAKHMMVKCADGNMRLCRVPGKLKKIWVREDDFVLVEPWSVQSASKGDIAWRYRGAEVEWLRQHGYLKDF